MNTDTPRTEKAFSNAGSMSAAGRVLLETSRQLERELIKEQEKVNKLKNSLEWIAEIANKNIGDEKLRANGARTFSRIIEKADCVLEATK